VFAPLFFFVSVAAKMPSGPREQRDQGRTTFLPASGQAEGGTKARKNKSCRLEVGAANRNQMRAVESRITNSG
jgi:hypothetical protein